jgi:nucleoside-diphosphate-sugar epimerase
MRILLTGPTGFIGSRIAARMIEAGHDLFAILAPGTSLDPGPASRVATATADIRETMSPALLRGFEPETYVHAAALVSLTAPRDELFATNVAGCRNSAELAVRAGVRRVVHISSTFAVGPAAYDAGSRSEDWPEWPDSEYGESRLAGERALRQTCREAGIPCVTLRPGNIYGEGHPSVIEFTVREIEAASGNWIPEWHNHRFQPVHVSDVVESARLALERGEGTYTVHDGVSPNLGAIIQEILGVARAFGLAPDITISPPPGGPSPARIHFRNSIERARRDLAWEPRVALREGLLELVRLRAARGQAK